MLIDHEIRHLIQMISRTTKTAILGNGIATGADIRVVPISGEVNRGRIVDREAAIGKAGVIREIKAGAQDLGLDDLSVWEYVVHLEGSPLLYKGQPSWLDAFLSWLSYLPWLLRWITLPLLTFQAHNLRYQAPWCCCVRPCGT